MTSISKSLPIQSLLCLLITFIKCTNAQTSSQSLRQDSSFLRALYESNPLGETELSDVWLCLAFALGWTVWLLSNRQQAKVEPSIFDQKESLTVTGNVLEVTVGEDADGTGIPVYLALIDYVVECHDPDDDTSRLVMMKPQSPLAHPSSPPQEGKTSTEKFKKGVVLSPISPSNNSHHSKADRHLQIRKCFYTNKLLDVGFANVKVLFLVEDPTTSELWDDYLHSKRQRKKPLEDNWMQLYMVYFIAIVLIAASLYGGYRTVEHLPPDLRDAGYISLATGGLLLFPTAFLLWSSYCLLQRWVSGRKGTIIYGSERWHCTRMACGIHPIMEEEGDEISRSSMVTNPKDTSSITLRHRNGFNTITEASEEEHEDENNKGLEMPKLHNASNAEYAPPKITKALFPNAGCDMNDYNVQTLQNNPSTVSSISSTGKSLVATPNAESSLVACQDATSHLMEAFESMSGLVDGGAASMEHNWELKPKTTASGGGASTLQKLGNLRRISSESRLPPLPSPAVVRVPQEQDEAIAKIYSV